jgi:hypothetical protein
MGSQKSETFPKACRKVITLKKKGGLWMHLTFLETFRFPVANFGNELPCFRKPRWMIHR